MAANHVKGRVIVWAARAAAAAGFLLTLVLLTAWLGSGWHSLSLVGTPFYARTSISGGALVYEWLPFNPDGSRNGFGNTGWWFEKRSAHGMAGWPKHARNAVMGAVVVPLWMPLVVVAGLTGLAWRAGRRSADPMACPSCGYNLTGLGASTACPECGRKRASA